MTGSRRRDALCWLLAGALLARGLLGMADVLALSEGGIRVLPLGSSLGLGGTSAFWSMLLATLALGGALGLLAGWSLGWLVSLGSCLAYIVSGIGDLGLAGAASPLESPGFIVLFLASLVVPTLVIAGLLRLRTMDAGRSGYPIVLGCRAGEDGSAQDCRGEPPAPLR